MSTEGPQRRLAAILAADIVGYSRLIGQDEAGTLAALKSIRTELIEPKIAQHSGRVFKTTGDGLLAEFPSVVNAVACATDIQWRMTEWNRDKSQNSNIELRIGVNLGDVIVENGDVFGDGVNVAARIEGLAPAGGIAVTETVRDHLGSRLNIQFVDLGEQRLKNIDRPIRAYKVQGVGDTSLPQSVAPQSRTERPSIAVLPFTNMSGDPEQRYFSDGITEDILTELSRFRALSVIARNSSFRFRGEDVDVVRVGRELKVQYVLEGSVRKIGNKIRITAQLIEATSGSHVWADRFDRAQDEIFAVQDEVVRMIVGTLVGRLQAVGVEEALRKAPASLAAYDCVLRADALPFGDPEARAEARRLSERAIELDPTYGRAYTQLGISHYVEWQNDFTGSKVSLDQAHSLANRAVALDGNDSAAHSFLGAIHMRRRSYDLAEHCFQKAIALNPHRPVVMTSFGVLYGYLGRPEEGIAYYQQAKLIDPFYDPTWYWSYLGVFHFIADRYDEAITHLNRSIDMPAWVHGYLAACYALMNQNDDAHHHAAETLRLAPNFSAVRFLEKEPFKHSADRQRLLEGLHKAGLPE
jgi:TolB-like protein/class 3 adenylate cyclase/tetratricopeptide (TPR) repeat protein